MPTSAPTSDRMVWVSGASWTMFGVEPCLRNALWISETIPAPRLVGRLSDEALLGWAWRIPFLASAVLVVIGLVIRLSLEESPAVVALRASQQTAKVPVVSLFREHTKLVLLGVAAGFTVFAVVCARDTFALSWATSEVGMDRQGFLTIILIAGVVQFFVQPLGALVATRWGVRKAVTVRCATPASRRPTGWPESSAAWRR